jgi:hypothetical protein
MKVTFAPKDTLHAFDTPNCDAWVIENAPDFDAFVAVYEEKSALAGPDFCLFSSFDDYDQACYTSGHAMEKYQLDPLYEDDPPEPSCDAKFQAIFKKFKSLTEQSNFCDLAGKLIGYNDLKAIAFLTKINKDPSLCFDTEMVMQIVPVGNPEDAMAAFPNGYFTDDLTPFENHTLAKHLREKHGYSLIAIGAQYMCFYRREPATKIIATETVTSVATLFEAKVGEQLAEKLGAALIGQQHLILPFGPYQEE